MINLAEFRSGYALTARQLNALLDEIERLGKITAAAPLSVQIGDGGIAFAAAFAEIWWLKLTSAGTGGAYAWTRQIAVTGGTFANHPDGRTGTTSADPAYEINANASVNLTTNQYVKAWREPVTLELRFQAGTC